MIRQKRSFKGQVGSNKLLNTRGLPTEPEPGQLLPGRLLSIGKPVKEAQADGDEIFTLFKTKNHRSVFDGLEPMSIETSTSKTDQPKLLFSDKIFMENKKSGQIRASILTETNKMTAPSFSIPAGPPSERGTCISATKNAPGRDPNKTFICDICYALEGRFPLPSVSTSQAARYHWILHELSKPNGEDRLTRGLISVITDYATKSTLMSADKGLSIRMTQEIGKWDGGRIMVPAYFPAIDLFDYVPARATPLPKFTGFRNSTEYFASKNPKDGDIVGFFRIHDSGDFSIGTKAETWKKYIRAWQRVAAALPHVIFWAPTRMATYGEFQKIFVDITSETPNFIIRQSAFNINDPAPSIPGLSKGSTVVKGPQGARTPARDTDGTHVIPCPVGFKEGGKSCMYNGCRLCWLHPELPVSYLAH